MEPAFFKGLGVGGGLIIAIGAQNAFVLSQGIRRRNVILIPLICSLCDTLLIVVGIAGVGSLVSLNPVLAGVTAWGAAAFLFWYGLNAFKSAWSQNRLDDSGAGPSTYGRVILTTLALTLLNPHVYLDTVILIGSIGAQFPGSQRLWFGAGAITASTLWFFSLSLGGRLLGPLFSSTTSWKVLDTVVGVTMWSIAGSLLVNAP